MFNQVSYNVVIDRLKAFANGHLLIKQFTHGDPANIFPTLGEEDYPLMHVTPTQIGWAPGERSFSFTIVFADIPRDKETVAEYQREIVSDSLRLAEDLLAEIKNGGVIFGEDVTLDTGAQATPFMAEYTHTLTGIQLTVGLTFPWNWSACDIPAEWAPGGSGSGGAGTGFGLVLKVNSVNNIFQNLLNLVDGINTTVTDLGDGRVQIDAIDGAAAAWGSITGTLSSQTDLQNALDLKADISSLSLVAFSGDYNDLSNLPSIPAAQIQSDWNQSNNVALDYIKNKPTITNGVTSVGLSISQPVNPAFTVSGSPVTTSGTLTLTANGTSLQYIDGKGALQTFPSIPKTISDFLVGTNKGDLIQWNGTAWVVIGLLALDDLADVNAGTPTNGQMLIYNSGSSQWVASTYTPPAIALNDLTDVNTAGQIADDLLTYDGTQWEPIDPKTLANKIEIDQLSDVDIIAPLNNGQLLTWNSTTSQWENKTLAGLPPTGAAGGDLTGTYPNPTVHKVHGIDLQSGTPSADEVWVYGGSPAKWQHQHLNASQVVNDSGVSGGDVKLALNNLETAIGLKQDSLVSGTNIKTVNSTTLLGSGNLSVGTVTSVGGTGTVAGLSLSGSVTGSGNLTLGGTLSTPVSTINDATTVGQNLVKLTNPSAITYLKIAANNTVSTITAAQLKTDLGIPSSSLFQQITTGDQSITASNTTPVDITGLTFTITSGKTYRFKAYLIITTNNGTVGTRIGINANVAVSSVYQNIMINTAGTGSNIFNLNALGVALFSGGSSTSLFMSTVEGILIANNNGTAAIQFSKATASAGLSITVKTGSILEYYEI